MKSFENFNYFLIDYFWKTGKYFNNFLKNSN